jgi:hypothetical protein
VICGNRSINVGIKKGPKCQVSILCHFCVYVRELTSHQGATPTGYAKIEGLGNRHEGYRFEAISQAKLIPHCTEIETICYDFSDVAHKS